MVGIGRAFAFASAAAAILLSAECAKSATAPPPPLFAGIRVSVATTGSSFDLNGYRVFVTGAGANGYAVGDNGSFVLPTTFTTTTHRVTLEDVDTNCALTSPDTLFVTPREGDTISVSFTVQCSTPSPLRGRIAFARVINSDSEQIFIADTDGANPAQLTEVYYAYHPRISPDGAEILFNSLAFGQGPFAWSVYRMRADGSGLRPLTNACTHSQDGVWSRDGARIAFVCVSGTPATQEIWIMNADGSGMHGVASTAPLGPGSPTWSPDGSRLAFVSISSIWVMNADGTNLTAVPTLERTFQVDWSPVGDSLLCNCGPSNAGGLRVLTPDGVIDRLIPTSPGTLGFNVAWSNDGRRIAFDGDHIFTIHADGTHQVAITTTGGFAPYWSP